VIHELQISIEIPQLLLLPGSYHLRLLVMDINRHVLAEAPNALTFQVLPKDIAGSGHAFERGHGVAYIPFRMNARSKEKRWTSDAIPKVDRIT
jgi:hypothetical protein